MANRFKTRSSFYFIVLIFIQNIIIFWNHYFAGYGFPWDFLRSYWTAPAFWTSAVKHGIIPQWNPFQGMGIPFFINSQTGFFYPFNWVFVLLNIPYTLGAAVTFQVLHIFFGALGMFFLLRSIFHSSTYGFLGALAFQFFGSFYANSEHVDIIRAFAISPWIFFVFTLNVENSKISRKILFIPIIVFVLLTGSYPGNFIAFLFILPLFVVLQGFNSYFKGISIRNSIFTSLLMIILIVIGLGISMIYAGPIFDQKDELMRFKNISSLNYSTASEKNFPGLFMFNIPIPEEISMSSFFITLPIVVLACFFPLNSLKKLWVFFVVLFISFLMIIGDKFYFWEIITNVLSPLGLSRFVINDYKIFLVIPIMIFAIEGLKAITGGNYTLKSAFYRISFIISWFILGVYILYENSSNAKWLKSVEILDFQTVISIVILIATILVILNTIFKSRSGLSKLQNTKNEKIKKLNWFFLNPIILLSILIVLNGGIVINSMSVTWMLPSVEEISRFKDIDLEKNGEFITDTIFKNLPSERPARISNEEIGNFNEFGQLEGWYMMKDIGNTILIKRNLIEANPDYSNYMLKEWSPVLVDPEEVEIVNNSILFPKILIMNEETQNKEFVTQNYYGINSIHYQISLPKKKVLIENEIYFDGWHATLVYPDGKKTEINAFEANDSFRAWVLPEGNYEMLAEFQYPNIQIFQFISLFSLLIYVIMIVFLWKRLPLKHVLKK